MAGIRVFCAFFCLLLVAVSGEKANKGKECQNVREKFAFLRIGQPDLVPDTKIHDPEMDICYKGSKSPATQSCCTRHMERRYHAAAGKGLADTVRSTSGYLHDMLTAHAKDYKDHFLRLIQRARNNTEQTFAEEFRKIPASAHRAPLENFFQDLGAYLKHRQVDLRESVANFYNELFPIVVQHLLHDDSLIELDDDYRDCLMESRQSIIPRPFADLPTTLATELSGSLELARLYLEAVNLGVEAVNTSANLTPDLACSRAVTRLTYCAHCHGDTDVRPCTGYCHNVMRGCLAGIAQLDSKWSGFVDSLSMVMGAMKQARDVEVVLNRLHTRISAAVLHAMVTQHKYYSKVITHCGQPKSPAGTPAKRPAGTAASSAVPLSIPAKTSTQDSSIHTQMEAFAANLQASKGYFKTLAEAVCTAEKYSAGVDEPCWNGHSVGTYAEQVPEPSLEQQIAHNPEIRVSSVQPQALVSLADKLMHIQKKLTKKTGDEPMQADWPSYGSGYGSNTVDDEDYNDDYYSGSGSGYAPNYNQKWDKPNRKQGANAGAMNDDDSWDFSNEKNKDTPYITAKPLSNNPTGGAAAVTPAGLFALLSTLVCLYLSWNG